MIDYKYEKARMKGKVESLLDDYSRAGYRLTSVTMGDLATRFEMIFGKDPANPKKYSYVHVQCRFASKVTKYLNEFSNKGYKLVFHVMGDMATRHELFFEKEIQ